MIRNPLKTRLNSGYGLGVGLSLAQTLVHLHGGKIAARSDGPGRAAEFEVRLPLAPGEPSDPHDEK